MPLDLTQLTSHIEQLSQDFVGDEYRQKLKIARHLLRDIDPEQLRDKYRWRRRQKERAVPWLEAFVPHTLTRTYPQPRLPHNFGVAAADGSDIPPDRHSPVHFCIINTGRVWLQYGDRPAAEMSTHAEMLYAEDLWLIGDEEDKYLEREIEGSLLAVRRSVEEMCALWSLCQNRHVPMVALDDGQLILWQIQSEARAIREQVLEPFLDALDHFRRAKIPVASYISNTRAQDVVNALRAFVCQSTPIKCDNCRCLPELRLQSLALKDVRDYQVFPCKREPAMEPETIVLRDGERTDVFETETPILRDYREHRIQFFYLNVGGEIARIEAPQWVMREQAMLDLVHAVIVDQCRRSVSYPPYPPALQEAHEQAVISTGDRRIIEQMVEEALQRQGTVYVRGAKDRSKRVRTV